LRRIFKKKPFTVIREEEGSGGIIKKNKGRCGRRKKENREANDQTGPERDNARKRKKLTISKQKQGGPAKFKKEEGKDGNQIQGGIPSTRLRNFRRKSLWSCALVWGEKGGAHTRRSWGLRKGSSRLKGGFIPDQGPQKREKVHRRQKEKKGPSDLVTGVGNKRKEST